jgi:hypothetical protein
VNFFPSPREEDKFPVAPEMEEKTATSGPKFHSNNMEYGTQVDEQGNTNEAEASAPTLRRSRRIRVPTARARDSAEQANLAFSAAYKVLATYFEPEIADEMEDPTAFLAKSDPDTLYYHQAMKAADAKES